MERIQQHNEDTRSLFLRLAPDSSFGFVPGQFISVAMPIGSGIVRPYSIASSPEDALLLEICLNLVSGGEGSKYLFGLAPGAHLDFTGPFGAFTLTDAPNIETVFVTETTAIAPIRPMIRRALSAGDKPLILHYAAKQKTGLLYGDEFAELAREHQRFRYEPMVLQSASGNAALQEALLEHARRLYVEADDRRNRHFYICGIGKGVMKIRDLLRSSGYERRAVQYEVW